jgi:hypothetical protein
MQPKHTPGPWTYDDKAVRGWEFKVTAAHPLNPDLGRIVVADIPNGANSYAYDATVKANAALIAASPDLLHIARALGLWAGGTVRDENDLQAIVEEARAAIAKATGGSHKTDLPRG